MKIHPNKCGLVLIFILLPGVLFASNLNFLKNSVISEFQDSDITLLLENIKISLNEDRGVVWHNDQTGNGGTIIPGEMSRYNNSACRFVQITNNSKTQQETSRFMFCKVEDGSWKLQPGYNTDE